MRGSYTKAVFEAKRAVEKLYDFEFGVGTGSLKKFKKEIDWEEKRERELRKNGQNNTAPTHGCLSLKKFYSITTKRVYVCCFGIEAIGKESQRPFCFWLPASLLSEFSRLPLLQLSVGREILVGKCFETAIVAGKFFR